MRSVTPRTWRASRASTPTSCCTASTTDPRGGGAGGYRETPPVPLPEDYPLPEEWKTPPLWGVADSAPYFHDGGSPTLESAIRRHHGDAEAVTAAYVKLPADDRTALVDFLKTLRAPSDAEPVSPATIAKHRLAMNQ